MKQKRLKNGLWQFKFNSLILVGTYEECTQRLEVLARMWEI